MKKHGFLIIVLIIIAILGIFLLTIKLMKNNYEVIEFENVSTINTGLVYVGKVNDEVKSVFKEIKKDYNIDCYNISSINLDDLNDYLKENDLVTVKNKSLYIFINEGTPVWSSLKKEFYIDNLKEIINKYLYGTLLESEKVYKVPSSGDEMVKLINSKNYTVFVIGRSDCNYCQLYLPVFNQVAKENNLDIYYIDVDDFDSDEYKKITDLDLDISAECTTTGVETTTKGSFAKPMTLITKNGKTVDCILGYTSETKLTDKLKNYNIIK